MHSGINHEIIFIGREARIAASLLSSAGREDLASTIEPKVDIYPMSVLDFLISLKNKKNEDVEYSTPPEKATEILLTLGRIAIPSSKFTESLSPEHYIGSSMIKFISTVRPDAPYAVNIIPDDL